MPKVSSERCRYIPIGFVSPEVFCSDLVFLVPDAGLYHFGVLQSRVHSAWMRVTCGRLKSDFRYSKEIVYNNFPWPGIGKGNIGLPVEEAVPASTKLKIERAAQEVLDARAEHLENGFTIADMYDPDNSAMFPKLMAAHRRLDAAVEKAYGLKPGLDEAEMVERLFGLYFALVG